MKRFVHKMVNPTYTTTEMNKKVDEQLSTSASQPKEDSRAPSKIDKWENTNIGTLENENALLLFEDFLGKIDARDLKKMRRKFKKLGITGSLLIEVSKSELSITDMKKKLKLHFKYMPYFNNMIEFIRKKENKMRSTKDSNTDNGTDKREHEENDESSESSETETDDAPSGAASSSTKDTIGLVLNEGGETETTANDITLKKYGNNTTGGNDVACKANLKQKAKFNLGNINLEVDYRNLPSK